jgi:Reverse transcriptase (RNA-dependent DNA polymerase)
MKQIEGQAKPGEEHLVCKLRKSLYGLKQSPRCWNQKIHAFLVSIGFSATRSDSALYTMGAGKVKVLLGLYVDDILIASKDIDSIKRIKSLLRSSFKMTDFEEVETVLGIQIKRDMKNGILTMGQENYVKKILARFNMENCQGKATPLETTSQLSEEMGPQTEEEREWMKRVPYREAVGSLMYLMISTRPDIAAAVQYVSRFGANPGVPHWRAVQRILQYLQKTKGYGLKFQRQGEVKITGHCDSDWGGCKDTRRSTTGYVFQLGGASISWSSRRQKTVALSSCEAEYMASCEATREVIWETKLLSDLGYKGLTPVHIFSDSQSAMKIMENPVHHDKTKHIAARYHFVREQVAEGAVKFCYLPTAEMVADSLTKGVPTEKTEFCRTAMGVIDLNN